MIYVECVANIERRVAKQKTDSIFNEVTTIFLQPYIYSVNNYTINREKVKSGIYSSDFILIGNEVKWNVRVESIYVFL